MEYTPPPFFKRGPSLLARLSFFALLSLILLYADARFHYMEGVRKAIGVVLYPLQIIVDVPGEMISGIGSFFSERYLDRARIWVEHSRNLSQRLFNREVPQILLLHLSGFEMQVLPKLLNQLEAEGAQFVTLPEAVADEAYSLDPQQQGEGVVLDRLAKASKINLLPYPPPLSVVASICPRGTGY